MAVDYRKLATQLRGVHARRSARAEQENPVALAKGGTSLDEILNRLDAAVDSGTGLDDTLDQLATLTRTHLDEAADKSKQSGELSVFIAEKFLPADPLLKKLTQFFDHNRLGVVTKDLMPQALASALATSAGAGGIVESDKVAQQLGTSAFNLLLQVKTEAPSTGPSRGRGVREFLDPATLQKLGRSAERKTYVDRMPALASLSQTFGGPKALDGFRLTSIQHLFPSTMGLYDILDKSGLDRAEMGVGGKDYSSNPATVTRMEADGFAVHWRAKPQAFATAQSAEKEAAEMAKDQLARLFSDVTPEELAEDAPRRRFILLDDGGKLIRALHTHFPKYAKLTVAMEQTDRGIQLIEDMEKEGKPLALPVVNMARSEAKKEAEGPIIGESVAFHTDIELARLSPTFTIDPKIATIIGYGAVGQATAQAMKRRGYHIVVHDENPDAMKAAMADGFEALPREAALAKGHMVVGATGRGVLDPDEFDLLPTGAVLVNASSGNHEFGIDTFDEAAFAAADGKERLEGHALVSEVGGQKVTLGLPSEGTSNLHRVLRTKSGKEIIALRSGAVVNMTLGLPPEYAQLTIGLLLAGTLAAAKATTPGLQDIPEDMQAHVVDETERHLKTLGLDLQAPSFQTLDAWPA